MPHMKDFLEVVSGDNNMVHIGCKWAVMGQLSSANNARARFVGHSPFLGDDEQSVESFKSFSI